MHLPMVTSGLKRTPPSSPGCRLPPGRGQPPPSLFPCRSIVRRLEKRFRTPSAAAGVGSTHLAMMRASLPWSVPAQRVSRSCTLGTCRSVSGSWSAWGNCLPGHPAANSTSQGPEPRDPPRPPRGPRYPPIPEATLSFDPPEKCLHLMMTSIPRRRNPRGPFAEVGPGGSRFSAQNQKTGGLHRRFSLKPFLTYQAKDCETKASPSGQRI